jgi:hypothetical protein
VEKAVGTVISIDGVPIDRIEASVARFAVLPIRDTQIEGTVPKGVPMMSMVVWFGVVVPSPVSGNGSGWVLGLWVNGDEQRQ